MRAICWDFLAQLKSGKDITETDVQSRNEFSTKEKELLLLLLDAQKGQHIRLRSQKGFNSKPRDGVEPKVSVQLHFAALPGGGAVTLDKWLGPLGLTLSFAKWG